MELHPLIIEASDPLKKASIIRHCERIEAKQNKPV
jgi:hypothetical protein